MGGTEVEKKPQEQSQNGLGQAPADRSLQNASNWGNLQHGALLGSVRERRTKDQTAENR